MNPIFVDASGPLDLNEEEFSDFSFLDSTLDSLAVHCSIHRGFPFAFLLPNLRVFGDEFADWLPSRTRLILSYIVSTDPKHLIHPAVRGND